MKKLLGILLALALLMGCTAAFADPITLTYAEVNPVPATLEENNVSGSVVSRKRRTAGRALKATWPGLLKPNWKNCPTVKSWLTSRAAASWDRKKTSWPTS